MFANYGALFWVLVGVSCKGEKVIFAFKEVMMRQTFKMTYLSSSFKREQ